MARALSTAPRATFADWLAQPEERRIELIEGNLTEKAAPDWVHSRAQGKLDRAIGAAFDRRGGGGDGLGGWWIGPEIDVALGEDVVRPDLAGWRRERVPRMPEERPVRTRPDWLCEVVSASNASNDLVRKLRRYHLAGVPHYWLVDPRTETLTVYRNEPAGYLVALTGLRGETVRAEPFEALELRIGLLFGDEDDEGSPG